MKHNFRQTITKYKYLIRLIFTIFVFISTPFLITQYLIAQRTCDEIRHQSKQHYAESAMYFCNYFNNQINTIKDNALKIKIEKRLVQSTIFSNYWYRIEALETLESYREMIPNIESLAIYFNNSDVVLASDYTFHLNRFIEQYSSNDEKMAKELQNIFNSNTDYSIKILSSFKNQISKNARFIIAIPVCMDLGLKKNATLMYILSDSSLSSDFLGLLSNESYGLAIFDKNVLIYANKDFDYTLRTDSGFLEFINQSNNNSFTYKENNISSNVFKVHDENNGLTFISVIPENAVTQKVIMFYNRMLATMVIMMLGIIAASVFSIYISYKPISDLTKNIKNHFPSITVSSEIKTIKQSFEKIYDENNVMSETVIEQRMLLMDYIFSNILRGFPVSKNNKHYSDDLLRNKSFFAINVYNFSPGNLAIEQLTQAAFNKLNISIFVMDTLNGNYKTIICIKNPSDNTEKLAADFEELLGQSLNMKFITGIGSTVDNLEEIRSSYLQALTNLEHNMKLIHTGKTGSIPISSAYSNEINDIIPQFLQCVQNGFEGDALAQLSSIFKNLIDGQKYIFKKNYFCYELISSYFNTIRSMNIEIDEHVFNDMIAFSSSESLRKKLEENISIVCMAVNKRHETADGHLKKLMVAYVDKHFTDHDITLVQIADNFNLSMYTCSRLFKEFTGLGFKEYITGKRMELAKELLLTTNKNVYEVSNDVGFENSTYFMSRFKANFGISPSKFRSISGNSI
ncbi:MAG: helix-turn-helix transcriptional regulator [Clostridiaceae bacterium]